MTFGVRGPDSYLSPLQQAMLFHHLEAQIKAWMSNSSRVRLNEPIDTDRLADTWAKVAKQNPILRTRFRWKGLQTPVQEVLHKLAVPFETRDLSGMTPEAQAEALGRFLAEDRSRAFALDIAPLWRVTVLHLGADRRQIVFTFRTRSSIPVTLP